MKVIFLFKLFLFIILVFFLVGYTTIWVVGSSKTKKKTKNNIKPYLQAIQTKNKMEELTLNLNKLKGELHIADTLFKRASKMLQEAQDNKTMYVSMKKDIANKITKMEELIELNEMFVLGSYHNSNESTLLKEELIAIAQGMNKTDYRQHGNFPRYIDLDRLIREVVDLKQIYTGWILERVQQAFSYDSLPPKTSYSYTFKTPHGHYMTCEYMTCEH